ncbi:MAG: TetR/AcrR family transcriptional regulator [Pseudomonadota bacterium]
MQKPCDTEALCRSILEHQADIVSIRNPRIALKKLTVIIDAALTLSNTKGFQAMSLRDLSKTSGVSMGGLYAYFDSKTSLLNMILSEVTRAVEEVLANPPQEVADDPRRHLSWLIEEHVLLTEAMLPWFTFAFMEAKNFPRHERRMATDSEALTERYFEDVIARAAEQGLLRPGVTPLLAMLIKPLLQDWYVKRAKYHRRGIAVETYIAAVQNMIMDAAFEPSGHSRLGKADQGRILP